MSDRVLMVVAGLIWKDSRLLICQRKDSGRFPGKWEFPGGKLEPGETAQSALERELLEELGLHAAVGNQVHATDYSYTGGPTVRVLFHCVFCAEGQMENRVFQQLRWVLPGELAEFDFLEGDREIVSRIAGGEISAADCQGGR